jgi:flagellar biosynthetic protein FliO
MEFGMQLLRLAGSLALVLGIFFALIYALKRWGSRMGKPSAQPLLEVLSRQSFGPRHHLILVRVPGERNVLVGISPQNMSLMEMSDPSVHGKPMTHETIETL